MMINMPPPTHINWHTLLNLKINVHLLCGPKYHCMHQYFIKIPTQVQQCLFTPSPLAPITNYLRGASFRHWYCFNRLITLRLRLIRTLLSPCVTCVAWVSISQLEHSLITQSLHLCFFTTHGCSYNPIITNNVYCNLNIYPNVSLMILNAYTSNNRKVWTCSFCHFYYCVKWPTCHV